jgi:hypothetical protein
MLRRIVWWKFTEVSEVFAASVDRVLSHKSPEDGGSKHL